jgi:hypothetical protein
MKGEERERCLWKRLEKWRPGGFPVRENRSPAECVFSP